MGIRGSFSEYATHIGTSAPYVSKLRKQGRLVIVRNAEGRDEVDFELSDRLVRNTTDMAHANSGANATPRGAPPKPPSAPLAPVVGGGRIDAIFRQAQAQERAFLAKMAELQYRKAAAEVLDRGTTLQAIYTAFRQLRDSGMLLGRKLAPTLAAMKDQREVRLTLDKAQAEIFDGFVRRSLQSLVAGLGESADKVPVDLKAPVQAPRQKRQPAVSP